MIIINKTWERGKKKLTAEEQIKAHEWQKTRVGIINLIARHPEIKKVCCICGNEGKTLHNRKNPYYITFICDKCKKDNDNLLIAEKSRKDIREYLIDISVINFSNDKIIELVEQFINSDLTLGEYCEKQNISRFQFNKVIEKYEKIKFDYHIKNNVIEKKTFKAIEKQGKELNNSEIEETIKEYYLESRNECLDDYCRLKGISVRKFFYLRDKYVNKSMINKLLRGEK